MVLMGRLQKASHQDVPLVSFVNSADYVSEPFVPNNFAEDGSYPKSPELSSDEGGLDMQSSFDVLSESKSKMLEDEIIICFQEECGEAESRDEKMVNLMKGIKIICGRNLLRVFLACESCDPPCSCPATYNSDGGWSWTYKWHVVSSQNF
ncbi:uncharacterized protein [Triticum aestivum]|uniref:uncharacterized protein n=1 Tax=Triticum aestivum TaxID=4565 RepID=UPI001D01871D|nr:uncharacterized protein LOC123187658 [Triticum aestivum]